MNNKNNPASGAGDNPLILKLKDTAILMGWIGGLILIAALSWFLTQAPRTRLLQRSVNRVLEQSGDPRRLSGTVSPAEYPKTAGSMRMGVCFNVTSPALSANESEVTSSSGESGAGADSASRHEGPERTARAFIFTFFAEGVFFPCAAMLTENGEVIEFLALNSHGQRLLGRISRGVLDIYARRIEGELP